MQVMSVASGLVYPGIGPEIAALQESGRLNVATITDSEVIRTFFRISRSEGIIPALESCHALAFAMKLAARLPVYQSILLNLSGRGDKDIEYVIDKFGTTHC